MKRWSLRAAYVGATLATALATLTTEPAFAHLDVRPGFVTAGRPVELLVELPALRPGPGPIALEVEADGLEVLSTQLVDTVASETLWNVLVRVEADPGNLPLVLRAVYADGRSVEVDEAVIVLPREEEEDGFPWVIVLLAVTSAGAFAGAALLVARRRA